MPGTATYKYLLVCAVPVLFFVELQADMKMNMAATSSETSIAIFDFINFNCGKVTTWLPGHCNQIMFFLIAKCPRLPLLSPENGIAPFLQFSYFQIKQTSYENIHIYPLFVVQLHCCDGPGS
jgi:hypothetical protein